MTRRVLLISLLTLNISCGKEKSNPEHLPDEYVLIEFAASLEEDYEKFYPKEKEKMPEQSNVVPAKSY